jgi:HK97 family phage major capsid protein/HK97 family phage prohead protease
MPDGELKIGKLQRDLPVSDLVVRKADAGPTVLSFSASSELPVERWFGTEILAHEKDSIRLGRVKDGAVPLLFNHNWSDPIGMIDGGAVKERRLQVDAHLFDTARAQEVATMIDGGLRNVSIGYEIHGIEEEVKIKVFTATDWEPIEISIVTVPADPSIGIGRTPDEQANPVRVTRADSPTAITAGTKGAIMADATNAPAGVPADQKHDDLPKVATALELEQQRKRAVENLCKANKIDERVRDLWITSGQSIESISEDLLNILEERGKSNPQSVAKLDLSAREVNRFSVFRAIEAIRGQNWTNAQFEAECSREIAKRLNVIPNPNRFYVPYDVQHRNIDGQAIAARDAMKRDLTAATASAGGYLVATNNLSFIELLRNRSVAYQMGARRLAGLVGNVTIPRQSAGATAVWLATEASTITESQQTFGQLALSPKTVGAYTEVSRQLLLQSSPDAEGIVMADLASVTSLAVDAGVLNGSGAAGQPTGITNTGGIGAVTGTTLGYAGILEFQTDVAAANVMPAAGGYVTTPTVAALMMQRQRFTSTDTPLWVGNVWNGQMSGFPAMSSLQVTAASMLFGDWSQVIVGEWGVLELEVNPFANFQAAIVGVRAIVTIDVGLRYAAAFSQATTIT